MGIRVETWDLEGTQRTFKCERAPDDYPGLPIRVIFRLQTRAIDYINGGYYWKTQREYGGYDGISYTFNANGQQTLTRYPPGNLRWVSGLKIEVGGVEVPLPDGPYPNVWPEYTRD